MASKRKAAAKSGPKRKAAGTLGLSGFCRVLANGIKALGKALIDGRKAIAEQERFIQQLIAQGAKPAVIAQAKERLATLKDTLESDVAQLSAFRDEFAADCH